MVKLRNCIFIAILSFFAGYMVALQVPPHVVTNNDPRIGKVLWKEKDADSSRTRIKRVTVSNITCDKLTLDVDYYYDGNIPGRLEIHPHVNVRNKKWLGSGRLAKGNHTVQIQSGLKKGAEPASSNELYVNIHHYFQRTWKGYIDKIIIPFDKKWDHSCLG